MCSRKSHVQARRKTDWQKSDARFRRVDCAQDASLATDGVYEVEKCGGGRRQDPIRERDRLEIKAFFLGRSYSTMMAGTLSLRELS